MILQVLLSVVCFLFIYFFYMYKKIHYRFDAGGLKYLPGVPIFGNLFKTTFLRSHYIDALEESYRAFPNEKYVGFADGMIPVILVRDPKLMKDITVKDFDYFQNRKQMFPIALDPLLERDVVSLKDEEWKVTRMQMTPAFTGARLRYMLPILVQVSKRVIESLKRETFKDVELKPSMYRYAGDSLAAAAFGIDQEKAGREDSLFSKFGFFFYRNVWRRIMVFMAIQFPNFAKVFKAVTGYHLFTKRVDDFLRQIVSEALKYREENKLTVPDHMDVLLKMAPGRTIDDLAGQFFFSYGSSFESSSGLLRFCFHELVINQDIQERLYQEIRAHEKVNEMTFEGISGLKYLDCVLNETSRMWSPALMMDRICTKPYVLPPPREGGKPYTVRPGDMIYNVVNPVLMDPQYFPNPTVFYPDRFSTENKKTMTPFTFLPFGTGPRGCLGARFVTLQMKVMIYYMLLTFKLVKCKKTTDPIQLEPNDFNMAAVGGTWLRLEPRE